MKILFPNYMPDGPSYCGALCFELKDGSITQSKSDGDETILLPGCEIVVTATESLQENDSRSASLFQVLPDSFQDYLGSPSAIDERRAQLLQFSNGSQGALMIGGECCYYCLVAGNKVYEMAEGALNQVLELPEPFPQRPSWDRSRCGE